MEGKNWLVLVNEHGQELCKLALRTRGADVLQARDWGFKVHLPVMRAMRSDSMESIQLVLDCLKKPCNEVSSTLLTC
jgi:hypothetical protein